MTHRYPTPESIACHPADRPNLNQQLPIATVYGQPLPPETPIIEDPTLTLGVIKVRIEGRDLPVTLSQLPEPRWLRCDLHTGRPLGESAWPT